MKNLLFAFIALVVLGAAAVADAGILFGRRVEPSQPAPCTGPNCPLPSPQQRITNDALPEDAAAPWLTVFVHVDWAARPNERAIVDAFATRAELIRLRRLCRWHVYLESHAVYRERFAAAVPRLPAVVAQDASGKVVFLASGDDAATRLDLLTQTVGDAPQTEPVGRIFNRLCPDGSCRPQPKPDNSEVNTVVNVPIAPIADTPAPAKDEQFPWLLLLSLCGVGVGLVLVLHFRTPGGLK